MGNYIRFDWMIKRLLRDKRNYVVLEGFLSVLIGRQIKITQVLESEGNQETEDQKFNRVDLLVTRKKKSSSRCRTTTSWISFSAWRLERQR